jgi:hypothetical protein
LLSRSSRRNKTQRASQHKAKQSKAKQSKAKQSKAKQNMRKATVVVCAALFCIGLHASRSVMFICVTVRTALAAPRSRASRAYGEDYVGVGMQCVSEFNWNQGAAPFYKSATGYFVGSGGDKLQCDVPDCSGAWSAYNDTLVLKGARQPRMFFKDASGALIMLDMSSQDISWTQNVAQLGRVFNGAL